MRDIGPYRLGAELGHGAMGVVYEATDTRTAAEVAVKLLKLAPGYGQAAQREAEARFAREAAIAQALEHPDIIRILDSGVVHGPKNEATAWLAMERLHGVDLGTFTTPGQLLPAYQVLHIVGRVAHALAHAHRLGVVHRDVKPSNVRINFETGSVKLMDFGVAHQADHDQTQTGLVLGSPAYMAPEQLAGRPTTAAADIYALGVMLFQLLTGHLPFEAPNLAELLRQIALVPPPPLSKWRPELPTALSELLDLAMQKHPSLRALDGDALAFDLDHLQTLLPAAASQP